MEPLPTAPAQDPAGTPPATGWSDVPAPGGSPRSSLGVGAIVAETFRLWWRDLPAFALLGVVAAIPIAWGIYRLYGSYPEVLLPGPDADPLDGVAIFYGRLGGIWFAAFVAAAIQIGAVVHGASRRLQGSRAGLGEMAGVGLARSFAMFGMLAVLVFGVLGTLCLVVAPVVLLCASAAAAAAVAVEGAGPIRALGRSWDLTRGYRWRVLGAIVLVSCGILVAATLVQGVFSAGASWPGRAGELSVETLRAVALPIALFQLAGGILVSPLFVASAVIHHELCLVKEGGGRVPLAGVRE